MKRLLLNLLAIASVTLVFGGSAWAQTTTLLDFTLVNGDGHTAGETIELTNGNVTLSGTTIEEKNSVYGLKLDTDNKYVKVELNLKLQEGDVISVREFSSSNPSASKTFGIVIKDENNSNVVTTLMRAESAKKEIETVSYTITSDDKLNGTTTFYILWAGSNSIYFNGVTITRPGSESSSDFVLTTEDTDYYTLYLDYNATIPADVTAYTGKLSADENKVNVTPVTGNVLPANTAVLVKTTTAGSYTFAKTDETADEITGNDLKGVAVETAVSAVEVTGKILLTLGTSDDGVVGFRRPSYEKLEANKAYILVDKQASEKQSVIGIGTGGDTTGITGIQTDTQAGNTTTYNIAGQRVNDNAKGLLIRNGKKFIRK